jgi:hypothetical protein
MMSGQNWHATAAAVGNADIISDESLQGLSLLNTGYGVFTFSGRHPNIKFWSSMQFEPERSASNFQKSGFVWFQRISIELCPGSGCRTTTRRGKAAWMDRLCLGGPR